MPGSDERCRKPGCGALRLLCTDYDCPQLWVHHKEHTAALASRDKEIERLTEENARLSDENDELRAAPWPEWATKVLAVIRAHSGYDGYDDADGVDLPAELEETMAVLEEQAKRNLAEARAEREVEQHKSSADHYRLKASEHRALAATATRERDDLAFDLAATQGKLAAAEEKFFSAYEDGTRYLAGRDKAERERDEARAEVAEFSSIMALLFQEATSARLARWNLRDGNAPGHGHSIPGIWDSDNGDLAGKPCAWCAVWKKGLEAVRARARIAALEEEAVSAAPLADLAALGRRKAE